jgi:hypothetical protein
MIVSVLGSLMGAFVFLIVNIIVLLIILNLNRRPLAPEDESGEGVKAQPPAAPEEDVGGGRPLYARDILEWEFEYARITASEAMRDRHTMINFYLLTVGVMLTGVLAVMGREMDLPSIVGTVLLWLLCGIGWLYFLKIIRFRQSWHDSARAMNRIKEFCIEHTRDFDPTTLGKAFRWRRKTLPHPDKPWTVFFYSAMLIALLDSLAFVAGGGLLALGAPLDWLLMVLGLLFLMGLFFFGFHVWLYFEFLK